VGLSSEASLIVASSDLRIVQLIRQAIVAADIQTARTFGRSQVRTDIAARRRIECGPCCDEQRQVEHLPPKIEPPDTIHLKSRVIVDSPAPEKQANPRVPITAPFLPPWKMLPWKIPPHKPAVIKKLVQQIDIKNKGSLIDLFI
jgi:hypothetical protein